MAIIKHIAVKNPNYDAATDYLTFQHDEQYNKPILDEKGHMIPRDEFLIEGINCEPFTFGRECEATNALFGKNQTKAEIKAHHYIISFDPRDRDENGLTLEYAQALGVAFAKKNFPGHQSIVCAHPDGHSSSGNIHVHIVINSVRKRDVTKEEIENWGYSVERTSDLLAGYKHHVTKPFLDYLKQETMTMCQENSLYQVDLLSPARVRITDREYWAKRKGQAKLDKKYESQILAGAAPADIKRKKYKADKDFLRDAISTTLESVAQMFVFPQTGNIPADEKEADKKKRFKTFCEKLYEDYGIEVTESRGRIGYILPDRIKPIRGRMLGTDFEKEFIEDVLTAPDIWLESREIDRANGQSKGQLRSTATDQAKPETGQHRSTTTGQTNPESDQHEKSASPRIYQPSGIRLITDLENCIKAQQNRFYAQKVKVTNLQQMAKTMTFLTANQINSAEELDALLAATKADVSDKHTALKSTEAEIKANNLLIKYTGQYLANRDTYRQYIKSKNKASYREEHRAEITLYEAARKYLKEAGYLQKTTADKDQAASKTTSTGGSSGSSSSTLYIPNIKQLKAHKAELTAHKNALYEDYSYSRAKYRELQTIHQNVLAILDMGREDRNNEKTVRPEQSL